MAEKLKTYNDLLKLIHDSEREYDFALIDKAYQLAYQMHGDQKRLSGAPYISHPVAVACILVELGMDSESVAAGLLHDVVEDAGVTGEELEARFGCRVKELVLAESEDKSKSWEQRKAFTLSHLADSSRDVKILALGDKLSNMRSTARDYMVIGDAVWERFNVKEKKMHAWYYCGIADALEELSTHFYYDEYVLLCRKVFGTH